MKMKRLLSLIVLALAIACPAFSTTLTGSIKRPDGTNLTGKIRITLCYPATDTTTGVVIVPTPVNYTINAGVLPVGANVIGNDILQPRNTYYWVEYFDAYGTRIRQNPFYIMGATYDLGAAVPTTTTTSNISFVPTDVNLLTYTAPGVGAISINVSDKFDYEIIEAIYYGTKCDNLTDDTAHIQAAIASAAGKGIIKLPAGICLLTSGQVSITSNDIFLEGMGQDATTLYNPTSTGVVIKFGPGLTSGGVSQMTIKNAGGSSDQPNRTQGVGIWIEGQSPVTTCATRTSNIGINNVKFENSKNGGVLAQCASNIRIINNYFANNNDGLTQVGFHSTNNSVIANNTFTTNGQEDNAIFLVHLGDIPSLYNSITGNTITGDYGFEAINLLGSYNTVQSNTIHNTNVTGDVLLSIAGIRVTQPAGTDTASRTHHNSIIGNTVVIDGSIMTTGIQNNDNVSAGPYGSNDNIIIGNTIYGAGIEISDYSKRIIVSNNRIDTVNRAAFDGISIQGDNGQSHIISSNIVNGAKRHGIFVNGSDYCNLDGNVTYSNANDGIIIGGGSDKTSITNNVSFSNTATGIELGNATLLKFFYNRTWSNALEIGTGTATLLTSDRLIFANNVGISVQLAAGTNGTDILYRDPADDVVIRAEEVGGDILFKAGGTTNKAHVSSTGLILDDSSYLQFSGTTFAALGAPANGTVNYCSDCTIASPCAGAGTGAIAKRLNGAWICN
jgi:hypothetical protein